MAITAEKRNVSFVFRWSALLLVSIAALGSYFAYDSIGPITPVLKEALGIGSEKIGMLYSIYSVAAIILLVAGGFLTDKLGVRVGSILYVASFALAAILTASGDYKIMLVGRFLLGFGSECFYVVTNKIIAKWFKGRELAFAFGINLTLMRLGTFLALFGLGWISEVAGSWQNALWIVAGICCFSVVAAVGYFFMDRYESRKVKIEEEEEEEEARLTFKDALSYNKSFWYIAILCVTFYSAIFPFTAFSTDFFVEKYGLTMNAAGRLSSLIIFMSMIISPFFGAFVDKFGRRGTLLVIGSLLLVPCHVMMGYTNITPYVPMILLGISFSVVPAVLWPAVPMIVREGKLGTAYSLIGMVQNIGLFLFPLVIGRIRDMTGSYKPGMLVFSCLGLLALTFSLLLRSSEKHSATSIESAAGKYAS